MVLKVATSLNLNGPVYYQGTWDANANTPFLQSGVGFSGEYYIVSVAGNTTLDGYTNWQVGDWAVFNGALDKWVKVGSSALGTTLEIVNDTSSNTTYKIAMTSATSGLIDKEYVDDIGLVFNPAGTGYASSAFKTKSGKFTGTLVLTQSWTDDSKAFVLGEAYANNGGTITMYTPGDSGNFSLEPVAWNKYGWLGIGISTSLSYRVPYPLTVTNTFGSPTTQVFVTEDADQSTNGLKIGHVSSASTLTSSGTLALGSNSTIRLTFNTSGAFGLGAAPSYGTAGQALISQGNGAVPQWGTPSGSLTIAATATGTYYPAMSSVTSGSVTTEYVDTTSLYYTQATNSLHSTRMQSSGYYLDDNTSGPALYYNLAANRVTLANYVSGGKLVFEVNGGSYTAYFNADGTIQFASVYSNAVTSTPRPLYIDSNGIIGYSNVASNNSVVTKTANYTATTADDTILVNAAGLVTITLPTAVGISGKVFTIKKIDATSYATTVATTSSQTIDGLSTFPLPNQWGGVNVQSDGANWVIVGTINGRNGTTGSF
jgi:hypothetical protein